MMEMGGRAEIVLAEAMALPWADVRLSTPATGWRISRAAVRIPAQTTWTQARTSGMRRFNSRLEMNSEIR